MVAVPSQLKRTRTWVVLTVVVAVIAALVAGAFSPVAALSQVQVEGTTGKQAERVRKAANLEEGVPLVKINENEVAARVQDVPTVASVQVSRSWPSTVVIKVVERKPVAKVEAGPGQWEIIDSSGLAYRTTTKMPKFPTLDAPVNPPFTNKGRVAGAQILAQLPNWLTRRVHTVQARDPQTVKLLTDENETIVWGTAEDTELKARVLQILLKEKGMYWFDVRNPHLPTVSQFEPRPARQEKPQEDKDDDEAESESPSASSSPSDAGSDTPASNESTQSPEGSQSRTAGAPYLLP